MAIARTKEQYAKADGMKIANQVKQVQTELNSLVDNIQQKEYNADSISQEINSIDDEIK